MDTTLVLCWHLPAPEYMRGTRIARIVVMMLMMKKIMMVTEIAKVSLAPVWHVKATSLHGALWPNAA